MAKRVPHPLVIKLEEIRLARGLSRNQFARSLGIASSTWTRLVNDGMQPNIDLMPVAVSQFPECSPFVVQFLLNGTNRSADVHQLAEAV